MSELEEKLENILGNPQAMAQIMSLAQSLNQGGSAAAAGNGTQAQPQPAASAGASSPAPAASTPAQAPASTGDGGGLGSLLGGLDSNMLSAAAGLLGQFNSGDDDRRVALLTAQRPFVREQRYARLDKAIQIARLSRLIRSGLDLFRSGQDSSQKKNSHSEDSHREEGGHV